MDQVVLLLGTSAASGMRLLDCLYEQPIVKRTTCKEEIEGKLCYVEQLVE